MLLQKASWEGVNITITIVERGTNELTYIKIGAIYYGHIGMQSDELWPTWELCSQTYLVFSTPIHTLEWPLRPLDHTVKAY